MPSIRSAEQLSDGAFYIFNGTATNNYGETIKNIVVQALDGVMHVIHFKVHPVVVCFNEDTDVFNSVNFRTDLINVSLREQAPFLTWGDIVTVTTLPTKETTLGKIIPTEEVSGLNNLNVIEDEPSDI